MVEHVDDHALQTMSLVDLLKRWGTTGEPVDYAKVGDEMARRLRNLAEWASDARAFGPLPQPSCADLQVAVRKLLGGAPW